MKLALLIHDFHLEVGHSRAMIEHVRNLPQNEIEMIKVVSYTSTNLDVIFPELKGRCELILVPFPKLYPTLLKIIFFHLWTFFYTKYRLSNDFIKIGIGVSCLNVDVINVQFLHKQWEPYFFKFQKRGVIEYIYKRFLYFYLRIVENYLYSRENIEIYALSNFIKEYIEKEWLVAKERLHLIYSGINLENFNIPEEPREKIFDDLRYHYPELNKLDPKIPTWLFVGAFERKGLFRVIDTLNKFEKYQLLIVGQGESKKKYSFMNNNNIVINIPFTKRISEFYYISDAFFFPTYYEPFGLVIIEAAVMGLTLFVTEKFVGASELAKKFQDVNFVNNEGSIEINQIKMLDRKEKIENRKQRISHLTEYSWENAGKKVYKVLKNAENKIIGDK